MHSNYRLLKIYSKKIELCTATLCVKHRSLTVTNLHLLDFIVSHIGDSTRVTTITIVSLNNGSPDLAPLVSLREVIG
jgi:hypothetical protein